ncbi:MAG: hypothetical protein GY880_20630 [Planctomycetaceae bacterium]|jgi:hypothetical protein|nr:hypothetical protein [Planctomycetaceae bacterium]MCP4478802.1 hypothetical protein [Planctomycetaceae bacterium]MCP4776636.1 hypothetical protein [Planctomycetaceae bacterium]
MRFFTMACLFCLIIASVGCMTKNWSSPLFGESDLVEDSDVLLDPSSEEATKQKSNFWTTKFGESAGVDPRAKAIEKRLGY